MRIKINDYAKTVLWFSLRPSIYNEFQWILTPFGAVKPMQRKQYMHSKVFFEITTQSGANIKNIDKQRLENSWKCSSKTTVEKKKHFETNQKYQFCVFWKSFFLSFFASAGPVPGLDRHFTTHFPNQLVYIHSTYPVQWSGKTWVAVECERKAEYEGRSIWCFFQSDLGNVCG